MRENRSSKQIILQPNWKQYFTGYLLSVVTIPLFGIGLFALYFVWKKHHGVRYRITDTGISSIGDEYRRNIDLVNIERVTVRQSWLQEKLGVGTLELHTSASEMDLIGMERPHQLRDKIQQAVAFQNEQADREDFREKPDPKYKPGSMDKMDYLTGLWQQGLLSDDDYENEKKHFE